MSSLTAGVATLLFSLSTLNFENSVLRPNGNLLLTTAQNSSVYELNPSAPELGIKLVSTFDGAEVLGINTIGYDKYVVVGGFSKTNETVYAIDLNTGDGQVTPTIAASVPDAQLLDGVVAMPTQPNVLLISDAVQGVIYRVDIRNGSSSIAVSDDALTGSIGVNGVKVLGNYAYFVNTIKETYGRFLVTEDGYQAGDIEIIATDAASDDFALSPTGLAYLGSQSSPIEVVRIMPNGTKTVVAQNSTMGRICSLNLAADGERGYVTTASGQVWEFPVPSL